MTGDSKSLFNRLTRELFNFIEKCTGIDLSIHKWIIFYYFPFAR